MSDFSKELIQNTIEEWSPKAGYTLSEEDAIEIITNLTNYFETLHNIALRITKDTSKELIDKGNFVRIGEIDKLAPVATKNLDRQEVFSDDELRMINRSNFLELFLQFNGTC
jgi:hypothetical protein